MQWLMSVRSAAVRDAERQARKARGEPAKGDRTAGFGKDLPPKGGRNGRGRGRSR